MSFLGGLIDKGSKKVSGLINPNLNNNINQLQNERQMRDNIFARDPNYIVPVDEDQNGVADILETKHHQEYGDGSPRPDKLRPFSFKKPRKDYNQSFDKKGRYLVTATYPLPPLRHEKSMLERNRKLRNKDNKFF